MDTEKASRVLFVIDQISSPYAGTEGQLLHLISNLSAHHYRPELAVLRSSEFVEAGNLPCHTEVLGVSKLFSIRSWLAVYRFARRKKQENTALCHVFFNDASLICPPIFAFFGIPTLISRRDMGYWYTATYLWVLRRTGRFVAGVVANSEAVKKITAEKERIPGARISVIYNGYPGDAEETAPVSSGERANILTEIGLPPGGRFVVVVANLRAIKRIKDAIAAIDLVRETMPDSHLVLVGGGDQQPYRELAVSLGVAEHVHFLGVRSDVRRILRGMDVGLLCSESEGYSNAIVEYMQARLPVVASDVGGNSEAVEHGVTGYLFPRGDIGQIAVLLQRLMDERDGLARTMGETGYRKANRRHGLQAMISSHEALYSELLANRPRARNREAR